MSDKQYPHTVTFTAHSVGVNGSIVIPAAWFIPGRQIAVSIRGYYGTSQRQHLTRRLRSERRSVTKR